jgi:putative membrane-bound dehydrogenase-like protein
MSIKFFKGLIVSGLFIGGSIYAAESNQSNSADVDADIPLVKVIKNKGDREGHDMTDPIEAVDIPPAPPLTPSQALASIQVQPNFVLELVAAEPLVQSPVAISFDPNGRVWVAEMNTFMPDLDGNNEEVASGKIVVLQDTSGDGQTDKRTVFLDNVVLPRTISIVENGILYSDQNQLYFAEVLADDSIGLHDVVDADYAKGGNIEHKPNGMLYGQDNWYYNAKSDNKYRLLRLTSSLPDGATEVYRNKYWKMVKAKTDYRGQWGLSTDDYGRLYHNENYTPVMAEYLRPGALQKNPKLEQKNTPTPIGETRVYPIRINPGVNRGYLPTTLIAEGPNKGKLANFTAASGNQVYRGDQFPTEYYGLSFIPEPAANLISVRRIIEQQGVLTGKELFAQQEIIASTDERFRPVNLNTAPDGSLYIVDMYHGIIQHKEFLTTYLRKQAEQRGLDKHNAAMGRIYRLRWLANPLGKTPQLAALSPKQLVPYLAHPNAWWRDMARQMLVQKYAQTVIPEIKTKVLTKPDHRARINALWTLAGLNGLDLSTITKGLIDPHNKVVIAAIELSSRLPESQHAKLTQLLQTLDTTDYQIALQLALTLGQTQTDGALLQLKSILQQWAEKPLFKEMAVSGLAGRESQFAKLIDANMPSDFVQLFNSIGQQVEVIDNAHNLSAEQQVQYQRGQELFSGRASCFGCHGQKGEGQNGLAPPLANSEWVTDDQNRLISVLLYGLMGPITVNQQQYNNNMIMPGMSGNKSFSDQDCADLLTYIRNSWGNQAAPVETQTCAKVRAEHQSRSMPFKAEDF